MPRRSSLALLVVLISPSLLAARFDPEKAEPYFSSGPAAEARRRFEAEAWAEAVKGFDAYLKKQPRAADRSQAQLLAAYATSKLGRFAEAARRFDALAASYPLLADYHRLYAGRAFLGAKKWATALSRCKQVAAASPLDGETRLCRADALRQDGQRAAAEKEYQGYLERYPESWREPEVRFRLAESAAADAKRWPEARRGYLELHLRWPTEAWGRLAEERLKARDAAALKLSGPDQLTRGLALFEAMRNADSEAALAAAIGAGGLDGKQACVAAYHRAQSVFKARERPRAAPLFDEAAEVCRRAPSDPVVEDLRVKALYQGARCHAARGETQVAIGLFDRVEREHPKHSFADDARLRQAELLDGLAERARAAVAKKEPFDGGAPEDSEGKALALLSDIADRYPSGDMRSEALFRLFLRAWRAGRTADARRWLDTALVKVPREEGWWDAGRTLYWLGRVAQKEGKLDEARRHYERSLREYPLSYYALSSLSRLREGWPDEAGKLIKALRGSAPTAAERAWKFGERKLFGEPGFLRAVELARLGLGPEARRELGALGIRVPDRAAARTLKPTPEEEELLWLVAVLYDRAGEWALSHSIPRYALLEHARTWPVGANRRRWLLSYPQGYAGLVVEHARKNGQPVALQFAIIREESAFDPLTESFANAVGLTQLTQAPAKRFAEGLPYSREALRDPVVNVTIGARELGALWKLYDGNAAFAIGGYNAGEGAVNRWRRASREGTTLDEFIELIPYDETRGYTKRVLGSFFAYHWLYEDGDPPSLPLGLGRR